MNAVVIEHEKVEDLPEAWHPRIDKPADARVTVRIEDEASAVSATNKAFTTDDPALGIWRDRTEMSDVEAYLRQLRAPRYPPHGSTR